MCAALRPRQAAAPPPVSPAATTGRGRTHAVCARARPARSGWRPPSRPQTGARNAPCPVHSRRLLSGSRPGSHLPPLTPLPPAGFCWQAVRVPRPTQQQPSTLPARPPRASHSPALGEDPCPRPAPLACHGAAPRVVKCRVFGLRRHARQGSLAVAGWRRGVAPSRGDGGWEVSCRGRSPSPAWRVMTGPRCRGPVPHTLHHQCVAPVGRKRYVGAAWGGQHRLTVNLISPRDHRRCCGNAPPALMHAQISARQPRGPSQFVCCVV